MIASNGGSSDALSSDVGRTSRMEMLVEIRLSVEVGSVGIVGDGVSGLMRRNESGSEAERGVAVSAGVPVRIGVVILRRRNLVNFGTAIFDRVGGRLLQRVRQRGELVWRAFQRLCERDSAKCENKGNR